MTPSRKHLDAFFALLRAGLFPVHGEGVPDIRIDETTDWNVVYRLAQEQSVQGLALQGIEELKAKGIELSVPKTLLLQWIGEVQMIEQRNKDMNAFIAKLITRLREADIYTLLVKGQGIAQCYEKPLWRSCGDVDLLLSESNYKKAKACLYEIASSVEPEEFVSKHLGFTIDSWVVELHGHMYFGLLPKADKVIHETERNILYLGEIRVWNNDGVDVYLPRPDEDIIVIFTHFLGHFCFGGVGVRQLCDLCRLLWVYRKEINRELLKKRLCEMGLMSEWEVLAVLSVDSLGLPADAMPFYNPSKFTKIKAHRACDRLIRSGNLGHKFDDIYRERLTKWQSSFITLQRRVSELFSLMSIIPLKAPVFFVNYLISKKVIAKAQKNGYYPD